MVSDLAYSLKEYMDKLEDKMDKRFDKVEAVLEHMEEKFAKKSSVDRLWIIVWSIISVVFLYI